MARRRFRLINFPINTSAEINDLTAAVTWANVPDANITASSITQHVGAIDHDLLLNFLTAEHVDWAAAAAGTIHTDNYLENATHTGEVTGAGALAVDKTAISGKTLVTGATGDHVLVTDGSDTDNLKRVNVSDFLGGGGDMLIATYDPTAVGADAFAMDNMVEGATTKILTDTERTKLTGIETAATADQTAAEIEAIVNHDNLLGFVSNEHIAEASLSIAETQIPDGTIFGRLASDEVVAGHWGIPSTINTQNAAYTLVLGDAGKTIRKATSTASITHTIPANASVAFPIGTIVAWQNDGTVSVDIAIATDTLTDVDGNTGTQTLKANGAAVIQKVTATSWKYSASKSATAEINDLSAAVTWTNIPDANVPVSAITQHVASIDHNLLLNFLAAEHVDWASAGAENLATDRSANAVLALTAGEVTQLANIGATAISAADWTAVAALIGVNTGDQTSIVGITGTGAQFDTAVTDENFAFAGGAFHDGFSDFVANEHIAEASLSIAETQIPNGALLARVADPEVVTGAWAIPSLINTQNAAYELVLLDAGKTIRKATSTASITHTIPANASVAFPIGTIIAWQNDGTVSVDIAITTDTLTDTDGNTGTQTLKANGAAVIQKVTATAWKYSASKSATGEINDLSTAVTWVNVPDANITAGSVTQHEAALTILESQITNAGLLARNADNEVITGEWGIPSKIRGKTASYTLVLGDAGQTVRFTGSTASKVLTIPANSSVAFVDGTLIAGHNDGSVNMTIAITTDTLTWAKDNTTGTRTAAPGASWVLQKVAINGWKIAGSALVT